MRVFVVTAFPSILEGALNESILKRAQENGCLEVELVHLRDFTSDKHRQIDDYPYGGGPGMVLKPEPFFRAMQFIKEKCKTANPAVILMTPQGRPYSQAVAKELTACEELVLLCGHYKGVDERVREYLATDEISIGDYILTGGELAALIVIDSVARLLPGVIGDLDSAKSDSFEQNLLDCPYYTRPENLNGMRVPETLLSGHHAEIERWRKQKALERTKARRGDLLENNELEHDFKLTGGDTSCTK